jgi:hypothetical protein
MAIAMSRANLRIGSFRPLDTARLRALEKYLNSCPESGHQPNWPAEPALG